MNQNLKTIFTLLVSIVLLLFIIDVFDIAYPVRLISKSTNSDLSVVGEGKIDATPDTAKVEAGITISKAQNVSSAQSQLTKVNNDIIDALVAMGIAKADITTSNYSIYPTNSYDSTGKPVNDGYNGNISLSIKVRDFTKIANVIETATKMGANNISGASFFIDKPEQLREKARDLAIKNAKEQAEKLSKTLGIRLGKVTNFIESSDGRDYPVPMYKTLAMPVTGGGDSSAEIAGGTQTISSTVTLYFEKK